MKLVETELAKIAAQYDDTFDRIVYDYILMQDRIAAGCLTTPLAMWIDKLTGHYRVHLLPSGGANVLQLPGPITVDKDILTTYSNIDDMPLWMQRRIALLRMVPLGSRPMVHYEGVGIRVSEDVFWIELGKDDET